MSQILFQALGKVSSIEWIQTSMGIVWLCVTALVLSALVSILTTWWLPQRLRAAFSQEQQQAEAALRQSEAKFRRLVDSNLLGVYVAALNGPIFEANDAFLNMVGYTRDALDAGQMDWDEMTPAEYFPLDRQALQEQKIRGLCTPFEKEYYRQDGSRVPVFFGCAIFDENQQRSIGFVLDLTARKQAEAASVLEERNRMAREIHDTLAQAFTSIVVHLDVANRKLEFDPATAIACIQTSYELAQSGLAEARRSVAALRPHFLENGDLYSALCLLAKQMFAHSLTQIVCDRQGEPYPLRQAVEEHLLRLGQEALMNACKHAQATELQINLEYKSAQFVLQVKDNGVGFELGNGSVGSGFGLLGMKERAEQIGAQLTIQSAPSQGTEVIVAVNRE